MKTTLILAITMVGLLACSKKKEDNTNPPSSKTIEYLYICNNTNANSSGYYWDESGQQQSIINVKSGWSHTMNGQVGKTAHLTLQTLGSTDTLIGIIKLNGTIVATDTGNTITNVQYVIK